MSPRFAATVVASSDSPGSQRGLDHAVLPGDLPVLAVRGLLQRRLGGVVHPPPIGHVQCRVAASVWSPSATEATPPSASPRPGPRSRPRGAAAPQPPRLPVNMHLRESPDDRPAARASAVGCGVGVLAAAARQGEHERERCQLRSGRSVAAERSHGRHPVRGVVAAGAHALAPVAGLSRSPPAAPPGPRPSRSAAPRRPRPRLDDVAAQIGVVRGQVEVPVPAQRGEDHLLLPGLLAGQRLADRRRQRVRRLRAPARSPRCGRTCTPRRSTRSARPRSPPSARARRCGEISGAMPW